MSRAHRTHHLVTRHLVTRRLVVGTAVGASALVALSLAPAGGGRAASSSPGSSPATCSLPFPLRAPDFSHGLRIDNRFLPMRPGTRLTYRGTTVDDSGKRVPHEVVFTVTDLYKVVDGIRSRVVHDVDRNSAGVTEAELAFFAQDDRGDVWNLGEYPEEYDDGTFTGAPSTWISGQAGAVGGIHMLAHPANPATFEHEYLQGRAPDIDFLDCAEVESAGGTVGVPAGRFTDVLTTYERSPLESRTAIQTKEHAPGVGIVRIGARNDPEGETLQLVEVACLSPAQLARVDEQVRVMDRRAYRVTDVYDATTPVRRG